MWPFLRKPVVPPPDNVSVGNDLAQFSTTLEQWEFTIDGTDFNLSGREFNPKAFDWARTALVDIRRLQAEIDERVLEVLYPLFFDAWIDDAWNRLVDAGTPFATAHDSSGSCTLRLAGPGFLSTKDRSINKCRI